jgi:hypothetical protein
MTLWKQVTVVESTNGKDSFVATIDQHGKPRRVPIPALAKTNGWGVYFSNEISETDLAVSTELTALTADGWQFSGLSTIALPNTSWIVTRYVFQKTVAD